MLDRAYSEILFMFKPCFLALSTKLIGKVITTVFFLCFTFNRVTSWRSLMTYFFSSCSFTVSRCLAKDEKVRGR